MASCVLVPVIHRCAAHTHTQATELLQMLAFGARVPQLLPDVAARVYGDSRTGGAHRPARTDLNVSAVLGAAAARVAPVLYAGRTHEYYTADYWNGRVGGASWHTEYRYRPVPLARR